MNFNFQPSIIMSFLFQSLGQKGQNKNNSPSISITPLPGRNNPGQKSKGASPSPSTPTVKPGQPGAGQGGKGNFVICEICDGYIKDLEQLRNHMQWIHKVLQIVEKICNINVNGFRLRFIPR